MTEASVSALLAHTPLEARLLELIAERGPISIGDFMADALGHPQHGYYTTREPFGAEGDFTTAPEISQIFGELIGAWLIDAWEAIGAPSIVQLVELGPGRGTLMSDILRVARIRPPFRAAIRVTLVETSGRLRLRQRKTLDPAGVPVQWVDRLDDVPAAPTLLIANEFFDCLPIRQFVRTAETGPQPWRERLVGRTGEGAEARLIFTLSNTTYAPRSGIPSAGQPEDIFEECEAGASLMGSLAARFADHKGRALIIDYGHGRSGFGDTFQAVRRHASVHPLTRPGEVDVTAHVDFGALARIGRAAGARVDGPVRQGDFLTRLGLRLRLARLVEAADADARVALVSAADRLTAADGMGSLFKVMALSSAGLTEPPGFSG